MTDDKPILWVSLTTKGRGGATEESLKNVEKQLREAGFGDDYRIIVADDNVRLLDRKTALETLGQALGVDVSKYLTEPEGEKESR